MALFGGGAALAACAPATAPPPPTAPQASAPAAGGKPPWENQWDELVSAAKTEGTLSLVLPPGADLRKFADGFQTAFPGLSINGFRHSTLERLRMHGVDLRRNPRKS